MRRFSIEEYCDMNLIFGLWKRNNCYGVRSMISWSLRLRRNLNLKLWSPNFPVAITRNISCKNLQKEILRLCLTPRDYFTILLIRNFCSDYDNLKRMIVNNEYYLLLAAMLLLMIIDEKQNHTAITMTGSMKHSILYAPAQQDFNGTNEDDTTKIFAYSNQ